MRAAPALGCRNGGSCPGEPAADGRDRARRCAGAVARRAAVAQGGERLCHLSDLVGATLALCLLLFLLHLLQQQLLLLPARRGGDACARRRCL